MSEKGYAQTTIAEIAKDAEVSVPTVYFSFRGKPALLMEAYRLAIKGSDLVEPTQQPWASAMAAEPDHSRALRILVAASCEILKRVAPLWPAIQGLMEDAEMAEFQSHGEHLRREGYSRLLEILAQKRPLRSGLSLDDATSILLVLLGPDVYRAFVTEYGWSEERLAFWMVEAVTAAIFDDKPLVEA